jgi:hypothetical protein
MLHWVAISLAIVLVLAGAWYAWVRRSNRLKALDVVQWINLALRGEGHVTGIRWLSGSGFIVPLRLRSPIFRRPAVRVEFIRRELPQWWLAARTAGKVDSVTFQADLDSAPGFNFEVVNHRWCAGTHRRLPKDPSRWEFDRGEPLVFATRKWQREVSALINALLCSHQQELLALSFRRKSPHFSATVPLDSLMPGASSGASIFTLLREIATEVSAR